ncbi:MAG: hypothetical protein B7733_02845 [Myxococcales bacterium FL481]|nr:MAG: hypothetical protein B7733_02845 [Myxococcales bacterium FL481]
MTGEFAPIADLVPHAVPMLMVEQLAAWSPGFAEGRLTLRRDCPFVSDGHADSIGALEWMGQTVAACLGQEAFSGGHGVRVGMIIGCPRLELHRDQVAVGTQLAVRVNRVRGSDVVSRFQCEVLEIGPGPVDGDPRIASADLTVFHAERPPE